MQNQLIQSKNKHVVYCCIVTDDATIRAVTTCHRVVTSFATQCLMMVPTLPYSVLNLKTLWLPVLASYSRRLNLCQQHCENMVSPKTVSHQQFFFKGHSVKCRWRNPCFKEPHSGTVHKAAVNLCSRWEMIGWFGSLTTLDMVIEGKNLLLLGIVPLLL